MKRLRPEDSKLERINIKTLWKDLMKVVNLERGLLYTLWELTVRPGKLIRAYLFEDRTKMTKPIPFMILFITLSSFLAFNMMNDPFHMDEMMKGVEKGYHDAEKKDMTSDSIRQEEAKLLPDSSQMLTDSASVVTSDVKKKKKKRLKDEQLKRAMEHGLETYVKSYNILNFVAIPVLALSTFLFFRKEQYYFAEHLVINTYLTGYMGFLMMLIFPCSFFDSQLPFMIVLSLSFLYAIFVFMDVFGQMSLEGFARSFFALMVYYTVYMILILIFIGGVVWYFIQEEMALLEG